MRIVFLLASADLAGGVRTVATYAQRLAQRGHNVTVVSTPPRAPPLKRRVKSLLLGRGWPRAPRPGPSHVDHPQIEHHRLQRFRPIRNGDVPDADVVIATWWLTAEWAAALSPRKGAKVHFIQGNDIETPGQPPERVLATWRLPMRRIVCSRWLETLAREHYGDDAAAYVPNGIDLQQFSAPPRGKQPHPTVGLVYTDLAMKGCDVAMSALATVALQLPDLRLIAFGSEPPSAAFPLPGRVEFVLRPEQQRIPGLYGSCDAWLWPSRREGFGLPILEAMACRTPVIATPAGAAPELLADGGGILLPAAEVGPMVQAIQTICGLSETAWRALSEQARAAAERHSWDRSVLLFEAELEAARDAPALRRPPPSP